MSHTRILLGLALFAGLIAPPIAGAADDASPGDSGSRPNVLWFVVDDMSPSFSCYGVAAIATPHLDRLAREGTRFANAFTTAPVCSPSRSALITGCYQTTIGCHHHRSGRGVEKIDLAPGIVPVPQLFQQAGYFTCIGSGLPGIDHTGETSPRSSALGKTDYNFQWDPAIYDSHDWAGRRPGQPFFMQVQLHGGKLRGDSAEANRRLGERVARELGHATDAAAVVLPPYYPRHAVLLADWAAYLDSVRLTDLHVGKVLKRLEKEGILGETLVIFLTDHGISHARGKQFLYDEGTHIPLVMRGPGVGRGEVRSDMVEHIDVAAVSLAAAGLTLPEAMQGRNVLALDYAPREAVFAARDRCDETVEQIRSVRTAEYLYIRNYHPRRPHLQPNHYKDHKAIVRTLRELHAAGTLDALTERLLFQPERPAEELYQWTTDRYQIENLAPRPEHSAALDEMRARLDRWLVESRDPGPETESRYDSDMAVYLGDQRPGADSPLARNVTLMKRWAAEGK